MKNNKQNRVIFATLIISAALVIGLQGCVSELEANHPLAPAEPGAYISIMGESVALHTVHPDGQTFSDYGKRARGGAYRTNKCGSIRLQGAATQSVMVIPDIGRPAGCPLTGPQKFQPL